MNTKALTSFIAAVEAVIVAEGEFRSIMPADWEGDPLTDAVDELRVALQGIRMPEANLTDAAIPPLYSIHTAPKDGRWFLAYRGPADIGMWDRYIIVRWHDEFADFVWPDDVFDILADDIDLRRDDGRYEQDCYQSLGSFTHWSPLPMLQTAALAVDELRISLQRVTDPADADLSPSDYAQGLRLAAQNVRDDYERAYGKPCDCASADSALHYGRAQGLEMAIDLMQRTPQPQSRAEVNP